MSRARMPQKNLGRGMKLSADELGMVEVALRGHYLNYVGVLPMEKWLALLEKIKGVLYHDG